MVLALLFVAGILWVVIQGTKKPGTYARIEENGTLVAVIALDRPLDQAFENSNGGFNRVMVSEGTVRVSDASCPDHLCVHQGVKSSIGETIICLPNRFVVTLMDEKEAEAFLQQKEGE